MANTKISAMTSASALGGTEVAAGVQSGANVKITAAQYATYVAANLGAAVATTVNKVTITQPATGSTLTIPDGVTLNAGAGGTLGSNAFTSTAYATAASPALTGPVTSSGSITFGTATAGIVLKQGANGLCGTFVANGTSAVTISNTNIAITDCIIISLNTGGGTIGTSAPDVASITAGVGFTTKALALDASTYNYAIIKNAA